MNTLTLETSGRNNGRVTSSPRNEKELSRLISAAVINKNFCDLLLTNPAKAISAGYNGEKFSLANEEQDLIYSIHAVSLADFAMQVVNGQNGNGNNYGNGNGNWGVRQVHQKV